MCIKLCDPTAHAEMQVITAACNYLQSRYLTNCTIYTTLEPCKMCAGALFWSKINTVVYGADDTIKGACSIEKNLLHPKTKIKRLISRSRIQIIERSTMTDRKLYKELTEHQVFLLFFTGFDYV